MRRSNTGASPRATRTLALGLLGAALLALAGCESAALKHPTLAVNLAEQYNTPDGMVLDRDGSIILSCPNFNDTKFPAKMLRIDASDRITEIITLPVHPETQKVGPLGVDVGPDGNLYVADNQTFFDREDNQSRLLRVVMKDGKATGCEVVATGFVMSNAVACHGDFVYVTESNLDPKRKPMQSGVYRFRIAELKADAPVRIQPGDKDPHLIIKFETKNPDWVGANGMGFDPEGNLFVCNFGDAQLLKFALDKDGKVTSQKVFAERSGMKSTDGLKIDPKTGDIYIADFLGNAVHKVDARTGQVTTLARNGNTDGSGGKLDRPSEVCLRGSKVYAANIDLPLAGNKYDAPHTISVIRLDE